MEKNKKTTTEVKELVVDARFIMRSYEREKDGKKENVEFLAFELVDPFEGEDFKNIALKAKWDKYDDKNRLVRPDKVFGWMSYYARKALRENPEVPVKVTIKPVRYQSKNTNDWVTYAAMYAEPTFVELEEERPVEVVVKGAMDRNTFELLASKALGIKLTKPVSDDDDDVGLMD